MKRQQSLSQISTDLVLSDTRQWREPKELMQMGVLDSNPPKRLKIEVDPVIFIVAQLVAQFIGIDALPSHPLCSAQFAHHAFYFEHLCFWKYSDVFNLIVTCRATWDLFKPRLELSRQVYFKFQLWCEYSQFWGKENSHGYLKFYNWRNLKPHVFYTHMSIWRLTSKKNDFCQVAELPRNYKYSKLYPD